MQNKIENGRNLQHAFDEAMLTWKAPEYLYHEKSVLWFLIAGVFAFGFIIYGLATEGWTFSLAIAIFAGSYYLFYRRVPPVVEVKLSKMGVKIGHHTFPYSHIKYFWINYDPPLVKKLYLRSTSRLHPDIFVSLEDTSPAAVREVLGDYVNELSGRNEPFSDALVRLFRL